MRNFFAMVVGAIVLLPSALWAQQAPAKSVSPNLDVAITYSARHSNTVAGNEFWMQGGSAELTATFYRGLGITADVTGTHAGNISPSGVGLTLMTATFGPSYTWRAPHNLRIFGRGLFGFASGRDSIFPLPQGAENKAYSLAAQVGGGVDLDLSRHFAIRLLQADWLRTQLPNGASNVQNNVRLGAGIVFRLPKL